jgi:hypothetical protein
VNFFHSFALLSNYFKQVILTKICDKLLLKSEEFFVSQNFQAGDFLIFQLESGYGLLRILAIEKMQNDTIWHLAAYNELFLDIDSADAAIENSSSLTINRPHIALTNRAFESTQVARMKNEPLNENDLRTYEDWKQNDNSNVSDRSVRLMLGLR